MRLINLVIMLLALALISSLEKFMDAKFTENTFYQIFTLLPNVFEVVKKIIPSELKASPNDIKTHIKIKNLDMKVEYNNYQPPKIIDRHTLRVSTPNIFIIGHMKETVKSKLTVSSEQNFSIQNMVITTELRFYRKAKKIFIELISANVRYDSLYCGISLAVGKSKTIQLPTSGFVNDFLNKEFMNKIKENLINKHTRSALQTFFADKDLGTPKEITFQGSILKIGLMDVPTFYKEKGKPVFVFPIGVANDQEPSKSNDVLDDPRPSGYDRIVKNGVTSWNSMTDLVDYSDIDAFNEANDI